MIHIDDCIERLNAIDGVSASRHGEQIWLDVTKIFPYEIARNCNIISLAVIGNVNFSKKLPDTIEYILWNFNYPLMNPIYLPKNLKRIDFWEYNYDLPVKLLDTSVEHIYFYSIYDLKLSDSYFKELEKRIRNARTDKEKMTWARKIPNILVLSDWIRVIGCAGENIAWNLIRLLPIKNISIDINYKGKIPCDIPKDIKKQLYISYSKSDGFTPDIMDTNFNTVYASHSFKEAGVQTSVLFSKEDHPLSKSYFYIIRQQLLDCETGNDFLRLAKKVPNIQAQLIAHTDKLYVQTKYRDVNWDVLNLFPIYQIKIGQHTNIPDKPLSGTIKILSWARNDEIPIHILPPGLTKIFVYEEYKHRSILRTIRSMGIKVYSGGKGTNKSKIKKTFNTPQKYFNTPNQSINNILYKSTRIGNKSLIADNESRPVSRRSSLRRRKVEDESKDFVDSELEKEKNEIPTLRRASPRKSRETEPEMRATGSKRKFEESNNFDHLINNIPISKRKTRNLTKKQVDKRRKMNRFEKNKRKQTGMYLRNRTKNKQNNIYFPFEKTPSHINSPVRFTKITTNNNLEQIFKEKVEDTNQSRKGKNNSSLSEQSSSYKFKIYNKEKSAYELRDAPFPIENEHYKSKKKVRQNSFGSDESEISKKKSYINKSLSNKILFNDSLNSYNVKTSPVKRISPQKVAHINKSLSDAIMFNDSLNSYNVKTSPEKRISPKKVAHINKSLSDAIMFNDSNRVSQTILFRQSPGLRAKSQTPSQIASQIPSQTASQIASQIPSQIASQIKSLQNNFSVKSTSPSRFRSPPRLQDKVRSQSRNSNHHKININKVV